MYRSAVISVILFFSLGAVADAITRVAVLAPPTQAADKVSSLLEASLTDDAQLQMVDRQQFAAVLHEQQFAACFAADNVAGRLSLGRIVKADVLVVLREQSQPNHHLQIVVFESRAGLRLLVEPAPLGSDIEADTRRIEQSVHAAITKLQEDIKAVVAVPDFVCDDLTHEFADGGDGFAPLIEQSLLKRKGVVVVELAEAQALARELAISGQSAIDRPLPFILLGNYRDQGTGDHRMVSIHLTLNRGETQIGGVSAANIDPKNLAETLLGRTDQLVGNSFSRQSLQPSSDADARQLYRRATAFQNISEFRRSLSLYEASLLLKSLPEAHRDAAQAALMICVHERNRAIANHEEPTSDGSNFPESCTPLFQRGMDHLEAYMRATPLTYLAPVNNVIQRYRVNCPAGQFAEIFCLVTGAKWTAGVKDDTFRYAAQINWRSIEPPTARYALAARMALLAQQPGDVACIVSMFHKDGDKDDAAPEMESAVRQLLASDNSFTRAAAGEIRQALIGSDTARGDPTAKTELASQLLPPDEPSVKLVPIDLGIDPIFGCMPAGKNLDLVWGVVGKQGPVMMGALPANRPIKKLCPSISNAHPAFDGRYVWTADNETNAPRVLIADPIAGDVAAIEAADGLPNEKIIGFAAAPLGPGRVCAAIAIGAEREARSYIAVLSFDPLAGKSVVILHEEPLTPVAAGVNRFDPRVGFIPRSAALLTPAATTANPSMIVGFSCGFGHRLVTFPHANSIATGRGAIVTNDPALSGSYAHDGKIYELRPSGNPFHADLFCYTAGAPGAEIITRTAVYGPLAITDHAAYIFNPRDESLYLAETLDKPFRRLKTAAPGSYLNDFSNRICLSNRFGLMMLDSAHLYQFQDQSGKPFARK